MNADFIDHLATALVYDPDTGVITWGQSRSNIRKGAIAGNMAKDGYIAIGFRGKRHYAHRIAWALFYGALPDAEIDHINGIRTDNRISNLRAASRQQNSENRRNPRAGSKSGLIGATYVPRVKGERWRATIMCNGVKHVLGLFDTAEDAHIAYMAKKRELHAFGTI